MAYCENIPYQGFLQRDEISSEGPTNTCISPDTLGEEIVEKILETSEDVKSDEDKQTSELPVSIEGSKSRFGLQKELTPSR
jgi:hypothetical protein